MSYKEIKFENVSSIASDVLIALLANAGFEGFEEKDDDLIAYVSVDRYNDRLTGDIAAQVGVTYKEQELPDSNWNKVWESNFEPVAVHNFCYVRAAFHEPSRDTQYEIVITPKMSFGTGHHATTYMMLEQMKNIDFMGKEVLDFGTGTGILAILAEKLNAAHIVAIDNDENSIINAAENIARNNCRKIELVHGDAVSTGRTYDIILANITRNVILQNFADLVASLHEGGTLVLSGLMEADVEHVRSRAHDHNMKNETIVSRQKWICLQYNR